MHYNRAMDYNKLAMEKHKELKGKISVELKDKLDSKDALSTYYTPGVGAVSTYVANNPDETREYTWTGNSVAVISDGSAVLGLGNIGPEGALPVMEGKRMLFKHFAGIDAVPIVLNVHTADEIVNTVKALSPTFGGINLEDIGAPLCFEVEERLKSDLGIPVFHDDQHGTAVVVLAGLINACKVTGKDLGSSVILVNGVGAAGVAIISLLHKYAPTATILAVDSIGIVWSGRDDLNETKQKLLSSGAIAGNNGGDLTKAITGTDIFIGVSKPDILTEEMVKSMNENPIVFALSNPNPEISYDLAKKTKVSILATGRSDYPNQVNNALAFPGIFRGALDNRVNKITDDHKIAAAEVIASLVEKPSAAEIIPSVMDDRLVPAIAEVIR